MAFIYCGDFVDVSSMFKWMMEDGQIYMDKKPT